MKLNKLMAAVAILAAGTANAALDLPNNGNGSLMLLAFDNVGTPVSIGLDLGLGTDLFHNFNTTTAAFEQSGGLISGYHKITWNFLSNSVSTTTPATVVNTFNNQTAEAVVTSTGNVVAGITGNDWSSAFAQFQTLAQAGQTRFAVAGADAAYQFFVSSGNNVANLNSLDNASVSNFSLTNYGLYQSSNLEGTHVTANNGANVVTGTNAPSIIEPSIWGADSDGWVTNSNFGATSAAGVTQNNFFTLDGNSLERTVVLGNTGAPINSSSLLNDRATWTFDLAAGTLTYETVQVATAVVPEPETYALVLAGLATVGALARRRRQA